MRGDYGRSMKSAEDELEVYGRSRGSVMTRNNVSLVVVTHDTGEVREKEGKGFELIS